MIKSGTGYTSIGPFPFLSSFQFREAEKATLEAFFEKVFFAKPITSEEFAAMEGMRWDPARIAEGGEGEAEAPENKPGEDPGESAQDASSGVAEIDEGTRYVMLCHGADGIGKTRIFRHLRERFFTNVDRF